jgi:hypothetical protein
MFSFFIVYVNTICILFKTMINAFNLFYIISFHALLSVLFLSVTLGLASLVIIITMLIIRLYHKPDEYTVPDWLYRMVYRFKTRKCKVQDVITVDECTTADNDVRPAWKTKQSTDKITTSEKYSNKEIAEFFDDFCFFVFSALYLIVVLCFTITLSVST